MKGQKNDSNAYTINLVFSILNIVVHLVYLTKRAGISLKYSLLTCGFSRAAIPAPIGGAVERGKLGDGLL